MLNKSGVTNTTYTNPNQILANVDLQCSVGCIVPQALGVAVGTKKIAKAGTPIKVDLSNRATAAAKADDTTAFNAVLLHDVDVTAGNANGTALIFGFVNLSRLESDVQTAVTTALGATGHTTLITFMKA